MTMPLLARRGREMGQVLTGIELADFLRSGPEIISIGNSIYMKKDGCIYWLSGDSEDGVYLLQEWPTDSEWRIRRLQACNLITGEDVEDKLAENAIRQLKSAIDSNYEAEQLNLPVVDLGDSVPIQIIKTDEELALIGKLPKHHSSPEWAIGDEYALGVVNGRVMALKP